LTRKEFSLVGPLTEDQLFLAEASIT
jgi:hypothetical protein